jgi:hypothetical protein
MEAFAVIVVLLLLLAFLVVPAIICATIASSRGRSAVGWFFACFFLNLFSFPIGTIIALVLVSVLPNLKKQRYKEEHGESERRRLREQLRQERMKSEALRHHATGRLDTHDRALDLDTRQDSPVLEPAPDREEHALPAGAGPEEDRPTDDSEPRWYYARDGNTHGPFTAAQMKHMREEGVVGSDCWVLPVGASEWTPLDDVESFYAV